MDSYLGVWRIHEGSTRSFSRPSGWWYMAALYHCVHIQSSLLIPTRRRVERWVVALPSWIPQTQIYESTVFSHRSNKPKQPIFVAVLANRRTDQSLQSAALTWDRIKATDLLQKAENIVERRYKRLGAGGPLTQLKGLIPISHSGYHVIVTTSDRLQWPHDKT